jgi:hypothetical protein
MSGVELTRTGRSGHNDARLHLASTSRLSFALPWSPSTYRYHPRPAGGLTPGPLSLTMSGMDEQC